MPKKSKPGKKKSASKKKSTRKYKKPTLALLGNFESMTGGAAGGPAPSGKQSNQSDGTGVPATKASAVMPE